MSTHPEIPKDHPRFRTATHCSGKQIWEFKAMTRYWYWLEDAPTASELRQDAAAHAAAWWFERAMRQAVFEESEDSIWIAFAWLAWGEQK